RDAEIDREIRAYEKEHGITLSEKDRQELRELNRGDAGRDREDDTERRAETDRQIRDYEREHGIKLSDEARQAIH
ncbi:hypothetical protein, partial [uncultured Jannaschia sp.]|uniref:hypothetical protein n=1 Tax=uncultured Jannaschia sp. TaxID=293347 RepID=UPI002615A382